MDIELLQHLYTHFGGMPLSLVNPAVTQAKAVDDCHQSVF